MDFGLNVEHGIVIFLERTAKETCICAFHKAKAIRGLVLDVVVLNGGVQLELDIGL